MERKEAIYILENGLNIHGNWSKALEMAIASLKTDEAYQLEYENRDCVEVVRYKDCKYWHRKSLPWSGMHGCDTMNAYTSADGYCFKAERIKEQTDGKA